MKKVLCFEDKAMIADYLSEYIQTLGQEAYVCSTPSEVKDALNKGIYDLYIIDLNVAAIGLNADQIKRTQNGLRTGWVVLTDVIYMADVNCAEKTVVFSDYISNFKNYISSGNCLQHDKTIFDKLEKRKALIEKNAGYRELKRFII